MKLFDVILRLLFPPCCAVCGKPTDGGDICDECTVKFRSESFLRCPECGNSMASCHCVTSDALDSVSRTKIGGRESFSLTFYKNAEDRAGEERVTEKMLLAFKDNGQLTDFFADELCGGIKRFFGANGVDVSEWILTYSPRSAEKKREVGYDQCERLVRAMSKKLGIPFAEALTRKGGEQQKTLREAERRENALSSLRLKKDSVIDGGKYLLIDDILTTGSTLSVAVRNLYFGGAGEVFPVTIARTYRKNLGLHEKSPTRE